MAENVKSLPANVAPAGAVKNGHAGLLGPKNAKKLAQLPSCPSPIISASSAPRNSGFDGEALYLMISVVTQMALSRGMTFLQRTDNFC
jgi:hypothetical protein